MTIEWVETHDIDFLNEINIMKTNNTLASRGHLVVQQDFCGDWYLSSTEDFTGSNIPSRSDRLTESQLREVCSIVNNHNKNKFKFRNVLQGIRNVVESTKDSIPEEYHASIDLALLLVDKRIDEYAKMEKDD